MFTMSNADFIEWIVEEIRRADNIAYKLESVDDDALFDGIYLHKRDRYSVQKISDNLYRVKVEENIHHDLTREDMLIIQKALDEASEKMRQKAPQK